MADFLRGAGKVIEYIAKEQAVFFLVLGVVIDLGDLTYTQINLVVKNCGLIKKKDFSFSLWALSTSECS